MYGYDDEGQFEEGWRNLLAKHDAWENTWLQRVYSMKEKWASCYMKKAFTLGMRSTQLSESVNTDIKSFIDVNLDIVKFFNHFEQVIEEKRYKESECEFEARQKNPRIKNRYSDILQQVSEIYTPAIFDLFQEEYQLFEVCALKSMKVTLPSIEFVITMKQKLGEWLVTYDPEKKSICCSCRKFETFGILCCHSLRVFIHMDVKSVPEKYILKRWTKLARSGTLTQASVSHVAKDANLSPTQRLAEICPRLIRVATEACRSQEKFMFLSKVTDELDKKILDFDNDQASITQKQSVSIEIASDGGDSGAQVKGFKKKERKKSSKRMKGWIERQPTRKRKNGDSSASQSQEPFVERNDPLSHFGVTSFTSLLMAQLDQDITTQTNP